MLSVVSHPKLEPPEGIRMEANRPLIGVGKSPPRTRAARHPPPTRVGNWPPQAEVGSKPHQGAQFTYPQRGKERVMAHGEIGAKGPSWGLKGECMSPKALPTQLGLHRQDGRPSAKFTTAWMVKTHPHAILPLMLSGPTIPGQSRGN